MMYKVYIPRTTDQSNTIITANDYYTSVSADALHTYNSMRAHDGQEPLKKMPRGTEYRKLYHWIIQGNYGSGFEDVNEEATRKEALTSLKEYNDNEPQYHHRLIARPYTKSDLYPNN